MKHRIQNSVYRIQPRHKTSGWRAKRSLEPRWGSGEETPKAGANGVGCGKRREKVAVFFRIAASFPASSQHFPAFPTFSHLNLFLAKRRRFTAEAQRRRGSGEGSRARNYARNVVTKVHESSDCYGLLREVTRKFAQIRAVVTRFHALLRVGLFLTTDGHR